MKLSFDQFIIDQSPPDLNYGLLSVVPASRYSSLMPWHVDQIYNILAKELENECVTSIVDACANIGVDTILFRLLYPYADIVAIELNRNTFNVLKENMENITQIIGRYSKSIQVKNMDCLDYIDKHQASVVYFDPPWPENYKKGIISLSLSGKDIGTIVNHLLKINPCIEKSAAFSSIVIVKLPFNFNFDAFEVNVNQDIKTLITYYTIYTNGKNQKIAYELAFIRRI